MEDVHIVLFELARFLDRSHQVGPGVEGKILIHVVDPEFKRPLSLVLRQVAAVCLFEGEEIVVLNGSGRWSKRSIGFDSRDEYGK